MIDRLGAIQIIILHNSSCFLLWLVIWVRQASDDLPGTDPNTETNETPLLSF